MIHRHTEMGKWQGRASASTPIQQICCYLSNSLQLCKSCSGLRIPWENLRFGASSETTSPISLKPVKITQVLLFYFCLSGCHWHCFSSVWSSRHWSQLYTLCRVCRDFLLGLLLLLLHSWSIHVIGQSHIGNIFAAYANLSIMFFQSIIHDPFNETLEEDEWHKTALIDSFWTWLPCCHSYGLHL